MTVMQSIKAMRYFPYAKNVYRLVRFITENVDKLSHVKTCPECKMADFTVGTDYTKAWCRTCGAWTKIKELVTYTPPAYLRELRKLKLKFNGGEFGSFEPLTWTKCYNDLSNIQVIMLESDYKRIFAADEEEEKEKKKRLEVQKEFEDRLANYYD